MTVTLVIADDHAVVREGLRALLQAAGGFTIADSVATGHDAVRAAVTHKPDVLVLDIRLPDMSGIEVAQQVRKAAPDVAILMLTMFDDDDTVFAAIRVGAMGYVLKGEDPEEVVRAIRAVAAGNAILGPGVAARALAHLSRPAQPEPAFPSLTPREREVLDLIAAGEGNAHIASRLGVATATVGNHITNIFAKLHVTSRAEAIVAAREAGLGE